MYIYIYIFIYRPIYIYISIYIYFYIYIYKYTYVYISGLYILRVAHPKVGYRVYTYTCMPSCIFNLNIDHRYYSKRIILLIYG